MKQCDLTYTDAMDRLVLLTVGPICLEVPSGSSGQVALLLGLLRKLVQGCLELAGDGASGETATDYTWEEKIECLVRLAKATGRYLNVEAGTDYYNDARQKLSDTYEWFCEWRHDEPYVVDEIKALLQSTSNGVAQTVKEEGK